MVKRVFTEKDFINGNFIREVEPQIIKKVRRTRTRRRGEFYCLHCGCIFTADMYNVIRDQAKYCSQACALIATRSAVPCGNENHLLYSRWLSMKQRCLNKNASNFPNYGGRGITIEPFLMDFKNYVEYVSSLEGYSDSLPRNIQLDRIDNNKGYSRGNLRWVDQSTNVANTRKRRTSRTKYTGVVYSKCHDRYVARINFKNKVIFSRTFPTELEAVKARDEFIIKNNLPHRLNLNERATTIP